MRDCLPRLEYSAYRDHGSASALQTSSFYVRNVGSARSVSTLRRPWRDSGHAVTILRSLEPIPNCRACARRRLMHQAVTECLNSRSSARLARVRSSDLQGRALLPRWRQCFESLIKENGKGISLPNGIDGIILPKSAADNLLFSSRP